MLFPVMQYAYVPYAIGASSWFSMTSFDARVDHNMYFGEEFIFLNYLITVRAVCMIGVGVQFIARDSTSVVKGAGLAAQAGTWLGHLALGCLDLPTFSIFPYWYASLVCLFVFLLQPPMMLPAAVCGSSSLLLLTPCYTYEAHIMWENQGCQNNLDREIFVPFIHFVLIQLIY